MNKSDSIKNLAVALSQFQGEVKNPANSKKVNAGNFGYKYAPLDEVLNLVRPILSKHGLSVVQAPVTSEGLVGVSTVLIHESGEFIELEPVMLKMDKVSAQGAGSAITYARRYSLSAVLGIASEDDDDANSIEPSKKYNSNNNQSTNKQSDDLATQSQLNLMYKLVKDKNYGSDGISKYIKTAYNKDNSTELTKKEASEVIGMLNGLGG